MIGIELSKRLENNKMNLSTTKFQKRCNILFKKYFNENKSTCPIKSIRSDIPTNTVYIIEDFHLEDSILLRDPISNDIYISQCFRLYDYY